MNKKNLFFTTLTIILSGCSHANSYTAYNHSVDIAADAIPTEKQKAYFACQFDDYPKACEEDIWRSHPNPHLSRPLSNDTAKDFLRAAELRGAGHVIDQQGKQCGLPQGMHQPLWRAGYDVTCADGQVWSVTFNKQQWRVIKTPTN
jgi:hypothetical protein